MMLVKDLDYEQYQRIKKFPIFNKGQNKGGFIHETESKRELIVQDIGIRTIGYDDQRGKVGLEGAYSDLLSGIEGRRWEQFMGRGKWKPMKSWEQEPQAGSSVYTTIDADLQMVAYDALYKQLSEFEAQHGSVVVMEVQTGKVRAIVNLSRKKDGTYIVSVKVKPITLFTDTYDLFLSRAEQYAKEVTDHVTKGAQMPTDEEMQEKIYQIYFIKL